jgi:hypothetical protein
VKEVLGFETTPPHPDQDEVMQKSLKRVAAYVYAASMWT